MHEFRECFIRDPSGAWRCVKPADLQLPTGRVQVTAGSVFTRRTRFMNVDLAALLDESSGSPSSGFGEAGNVEPSRHVDQEPLT